MTTVLKGKDKLSAAEFRQALLAFSSSLRPARRSPEALQRERDIAEWNAAVDARKAEKRARKGTK